MDLVQTPLGKGTVREHRRNGNVVVVIGGRAVVFPAADVKPLEQAKGAARRPRSAPANATEVPEPARSTSGSSEIDLHGLSVDEAIERTTTAIDAALRDGRLQVRIIHGRSGGRLRVAVHRLLRGVPSIQGFRIDRQNPGVTIVDF